MIVILTCKEDASADYVIKKLIERRLAFKRINLDEVRKSGFTTSRPVGNQWEFDDGQTRLSSDEIGVIWQRRIPRRQIMHNDPTIGRYLTQEWRLYWEWWLNQIPSEKVLDTESSIKSASNKMLQLKVAARLGLKVPDTVITSNPDEYTSFIQRHKAVIAKTLGGFGQIIEENKSFGTIFTTRIDVGNNPDPSSIRMVPIIIQEEIKKSYELRITVVDNTIFPCKIESQNSPKTQLDWRRYDFDRVPHSRVELPTNISAKLLMFMKSFGIHFAAFDFAVTPDDEYVFFEMNPNSQWVWIEHYTDLKITDELIEALHKRCRL
ncbi:hypothetical protein LDC_1500 [sediment metagenome]|uniref:ATP-grasp domain-containing protein n=1 Tax=sediment metagenome TaxID=749907 RepID=D9PIZ1_9ZZZZ